VKPQKELQRKAIHLGTVILPMILLHLSQRDGKLFLALLTAIAIVVEILRLEWEPFKKVFNAMFGDMLKEKEVKNLTGATAFISTALFCAVIFNWNIVVLSIFFLSIGDPVASVIGSRFGKITVFGDKTLEGFLAFLLSTIPIAFLYPLLPLSVRIIGAFAAAFFELIKTPIDDNVVVLVGSNTVMQIAMFFAAK